jgi:hypothetical protein
MFEDPESSVDAAANIPGVGNQPFVGHGGSLAHDSIEENDDEAAEEDGEDEEEDEYEEEYMGFENLEKQTEYIDSIERTMKLMASKILYLEKAVEANAAAPKVESKPTNRNLQHEANKLSFGGSDIHADGKFAGVVQKEKEFNPLINQEVEMAWSKTLFREFRGLKSLEKDKSEEPFLSSTIKDLTKHYINKDLKPYMKKGVIRRDRGSIGSVNNSIDTVGTNYSKS